MNLPNLRRKLKRLNKKVSLHALARKQGLYNVSGNTPTRVGPSFLVDRSRNYRRNRFLRKNDPTVRQIKDGGITKRWN